MILALKFSVNVEKGKSDGGLSNLRIPGESVCGTTFGEELLVGVYGKLFTGKLCCAGRWERVKVEWPHNCCSIFPPVLSG